MGTHPCELHSLGKGFAGTLPQSGVVHLIIDFVGIFTEPCSKSLQGPDGQTPRVNFSRHLTWVLGCLGIPRQLIQELCRGRAKQSLNDGTHARLRRWAVFFGYRVPREQRLKVDTPELWATIHKTLLRQTLVALDADPQSHHDRAITGRIVGEIAR